MILLSVIVPIYNVQDYVEDCLNSILRQIDFSCTELILINDGSTDESLNKVRNSLLSFSDQKNIFLIDQENKGLSAARNAGIDISNGKYLSFIDSDDIVFEGFFQKIFNVLNFNSPDIIKFKFQTFKSFGFFNEHNLYINKQGLINVDYDLVIDLFNDSSWYAWSHIYKKNLFNEILFPVGLNFEDVATIPYLYIKCKTIYFLDFYLYGYRLRDGSITSSTNSQVINKNIISLREILNKLLDSASVDIRFYILYIFFIRVYFSFIIKNKGFFNSYQEWLMFKNKSKKIKVKEEILFRSKKHVVYYILYNYFGFLSNFIMIYITRLHGIYKRIFS